MGHDEMTLLEGERTDRLLTILAQPVEAHPQRGYGEVSVAGWRQPHASTTWRNSAASVWLTLMVRRHVSEILIRAGA
jgi:hypothetical protein